MLQPPGAGLFIIVAAQFIKLYFGTSKLRNCSLRFIIKGLRTQCERDYILKQIISLITPLVQKHIRCDERDSIQR